MDARKLRSKDDVETLLVSVFLRGFSSQTVSFATALIGPLTTRTQITEHVFAMKVSVIGNLEIHLERSGFFAGWHSCCSITWAGWISAACAISCIGAG